MIKAVYGFVSRLSFPYYCPEAINGEKKVIIYKCTRRRSMNRRAQTNTNKANLFGKIAGSIFAVPILDSDKVSLGLANYVSTAQTKLGLLSVLL
jgi:hypothetical protein